MRRSRCALLLGVLVLSACGSEPDSTSAGAASGAGGAAAGPGATSGATSGGPAGATTGSGGVMTSGNIAGIEGGRYHSCLATKSGSVYCWGQGAYGALGNNGSYKGIPTKALVIDDAIDVQCGGRFTCARRKAGTLFCWGEDQAGQLGGPQTKECGDAVIDSVCAPIPQVVSGVADPVGLALGRDHACALLGDGTVSCWGDDAEGQLGNANLMPSATPAVVPGVQGAKQVSAGDAHTCALVGSPGKVLCWGRNADGQVGTGKVTAREPTPVEVAGIDDAVEVQTGGEHTCVRRATGSLACWGYNYFGQIGKGSKQPTRVTSPAEVLDVADAVQLAMGRYHTCALHAGGTISCWGFNEKGELGDGTSQDRSNPTAVSTISDAAFIAAGSWHTCAILASGPVMCWGDDLGGQLGIDGVNKTSNPTPVAVKELPTE